MRKQFNYWENLSIVIAKNGNTLYDSAESEKLTEELSREILNRVDEIGFMGLSQLDGVPFRDMPKLRVLNLYPSEKKKDPKLKSLDGIEEAINLSELIASEQEISSIKGLSSLDKLKELDLRLNQIQDIKPLLKCKALRSVLLSVNKISDVSVLTQLPKLERIWLSRNPIKDILPLAKLKKLNELEIPGSLPKSNLEEFKKLRPDVNITY